MVASWRGDKRTSSQRGYSRRWQKLRNAYIQANPLCVYCKKQGKVTAAKVVDHIKKHEGDEALLYDWSNLQSLCKLHHDSTKQREEKRNVKVVQIGVDGYPVEQE